MRFWSRGRGGFRGGEGGERGLIHCLFPADFFRRVYLACCGVSRDGEEAISVVEGNVLGLSAFLLVILASLVVAFFVVARQIYLVYLRQLFRETYHIKLNDTVSIARRFDDGTGHFFLVYPQWRFPNKDGSCDRRRANNAICYGKSVLEVGGFRISSTQPVHIVWLVNALRRRDVTIAQSSEEATKYQQALRMKRMIAEANTLDSLVERYGESKSYTEFEKFCAHLFRAQGYRAEVTPATNDGGCDVLLYEGSELVALVECKCFSLSHKVGRPLLQKLYGANAVLHAKRLIFVTTSEFTPEAQKYACDLNGSMELVDGHALLRMMEKNVAPDGAKLPIALDEWKLTREDLVARYPPDYPPPAIDLG